MNALKKLFEIDHADPWLRTEFTKKLDKFFRVEDYKLDVRYGMVKHEVVPKIDTRDWVDQFTDDLDHPGELIKKSYKAAKAKISTMFKV